MSSVHDKLSRVRKPRVHISYEVETGGATEKKHLPFLVGVVGSYSGNNPTGKLSPLRDRKFVNIDRDNFNDVLKSMTPGVRVEVPNLISDDPEQKGKMTSFDLKFESMEDFTPGKLAQQITPIKRLLDVRSKLNDLLVKAQASPDLEKELEDVLKDKTKAEQAANELGIKNEE
jgi:type VI secretion system protein ImpB